MISGIYCLTNLINSKKYIGQSLDIKNRWWCHKNPQLDPKSVITRALKKYGVENFRFEMLIITNNINDMNYYEEECIKIYDTLTINGKGYNVKKGGNNHEQQESTKEKISRANKGRFKGMDWEEKYGEEKAKEIKEKLSKTLKENNRENGQKGFSTGSKHREESREKCSKSVKKTLQDKKLNNPEEWEKTRQRKSEAAKKAWASGRKTNEGMGGWKMTEEQKKRASEITKKWWSDLRENDPKKYETEKQKRVKNLPNK